MAEGEGSQTDEPLLIVLRVIKARIKRNFEMFGKMDPQATVEWIDKGQDPVEIAKTRVHWNGHMTPKWDHVCRGRPYPGQQGEVKVEFKVFEADVVGASELMGSSVVSLADLVRLPSGRADPQASVTGPMKELVLTLPKKGSKKVETTGSITVQAILVHQSAAGEFDQAVMELTRVDSNMFEAPVKRLQVSGGTAPFFNLVWKDPPEGKSASYYIGKDLSHAVDEIQFYETLLTKGKKDEGLNKLLQYVPDYAGIFTAAEDGTEQLRELLVMRNLKDGQKGARMLDIKMGQKTGQAGWQGKSRSAALRQSIVDGLTNTACEGFRLEGFDKRPPALLSMDPLLDVGSTTNVKLLKKAHRVLLQRMAAQEMLMHYLDVHEDLPMPDAKGLQSTLGPSELTELVLQKSVAQLCDLALSCRRSPVPQKWIGSSVALGFDCAELPPRTAGTEDAVRRKTLVSIFDWGRSELNTLDRYMQLSEADQKDRSEFWSYYVGGIDRLVWEVSRAYVHRMGVADAWTDVIFRIHDFDSMTANDFLGKLRVPLQECGSTTKELEGMSGSKRGEITFSIAWQPYPQPSRIRGAWRVTVEKAEKLPASDGVMIMSSSDPFVEVIAISQDGKRGFRQVTKVLVKNLSPEYKETFEIPVVSKPDFLQETFRSLGVQMPSSSSAQEFMLPMEEDVWDALGRRFDDKAAEKGMAEFVQMLDQAALAQIQREGGDGGMVTSMHSFHGQHRDLPGEEANPLTADGVNPEFDEEKKCCLVM